MRIRYIIRPPNIKTTPGNIKEALSARLTVNPLISSKVPDWRRDFFLFYPDEVRNVDMLYSVLRDFQLKNKLHQRNYIHNCDIKTPEDYEAHEGKYVIRPLRHTKGQGWELSDRVSTDPTKYCSPLFPKRHEYRLIYSRGHKVATLKKRLPQEGIPIDQPWNHSRGSIFIRVDNEINNRLRHTSVKTSIEQCPIIKFAHLVAVDVLYGRINGEPAYAVTEFNLCPSMTIKTNLNRLKEIWDDSSGHI